MKRKSIRGLTLLELLISISILAVLMIIAFNVVFTTKRTATQLEGFDVLARKTQRMLGMMKDDLLQAKKIFSNDALGTGYYDMIDFTNMPNVISDAKIPVVDPDGSISPSEPNFSSANVGNILFFAKGAGHYEGDGNGTTYRVNLYVFKLYYLTEKTDLKLPNKDGRLDLVSAQSRTLADYKELMELKSRIPMDNFQSFIDNLSNATIEGEQVTYAWNSEAASAAGAFYPLEELLKTNPSADTNYRIRFTKFDYFLVDTYTLSDVSICSVAYNNMPLINDIRVPAFGTAQGSFPNGLEIIIVGNKRKRRVYARLVGVCYYKGKYIAVDNSILASASEY